MRYLHLWPKRKKWTFAMSDGAECSRTKCTLTLQSDVFECSLEQGDVLHHISFTEIRGQVEEVRSVSSRV